MWERERMGTFFRVRFSLVLGAGEVGVGQDVGFRPRGKERHALAKGNCMRLVHPDTARAPVGAEKDNGRPDNDFGYTN